MDKREEKRAMLAQGSQKKVTQAPAVRHCHYDGSMCDGEMGMTKYSVERWKRNRSIRIYAQ